MLSLAMILDPVDIVWFPKEKIVVESKHVTFDEAQLGQPTNGYLPIDKSFIHFLNTFAAIDVLARQHGATSHAGDALGRQSSMNSTSGVPS